VLISPANGLFTDSFDFHYEYKDGKLQVDHEFFQEKFSLSTSKNFGLTCLLLLFAFSFLLVLVVPVVVVFLTFVFHVALVTQVNKNCQIIGLSCVSSKTTDSSLRSIHATVSHFPSFS